MKKIRFAALLPLSVLFVNPVVAQEKAGTPMIAPADNQTEKPSKTEDEKFAADALQPVREPSKEAMAALEMIDAALEKVSEDVKREGNSWQFQMGERIVVVVTDPLAERMRVMVPIIPAEALSTGLMARLLQANFDSALDARYAVAQDLLWGTFIHPLVKMDEREFLSGLLQTINVAENFGSSFSSGALVFGGGDSQAIIDKQLEEILKEREKASKI